MKRACSLLFVCLLAGSVTVALSTGSVLELPVTFSVQNVNGSRIPCSSDGKTYTVRGHLVAPETVMSAADPSATLYLHGGTSGEWMWHLKVAGLEEYDYATQMAKLGHVSVVIDMLGYDSSDHPVGTEVCIGSEADIVHQIIQKLRSGEYGLSGGAGLPFSRVALAGQSFGGIRAESETVSFHDADALIVVGWADTPFRLATKAPEVVSNVAQTCATGGEPVEDDGTGPNGYSYAWPSREEEVRDAMYDAEPAVLNAVKPLINRDPCGSFQSVPTAVMMHNLLIQTVRLPVFSSTATTI